MGVHNQYSKSDFAIVLLVVGQSAALRRLWAWECNTVRVGIAEFDFKLFANGEFVIRAIASLQVFEQPHRGLD
jgi:hypothetical protein